MTYAHLIYTLFCPSVIWGARSIPRFFSFRDFKRLRDFIILEHCYLWMLSSLFHYIWFIGKFVVECWYSCWKGIKNAPFRVDRFVDGYLKNLIYFLKIRPKITLLKVWNSFYFSFGLYLIIKCQCLYLKVTPYVFVFYLNGPSEDVFNNLLVWFIF